MRITVAALAALLAGCASTGGGQGARALPQGARYVAMGSSFAAGAGIAPDKPGPKRCGRSERSYASLLAQRLDLTLDDQTCGGATTANVLTRWSELPAQIDAVTPDTRLVTLTIGGNDINYAGYLISSSCGPDGMVTLGAQTMRCPQVPAPDEAAYSRLENNLGAIVRQVKARAPSARIVFVQYVTLVPDQPCDGARLVPDKAIVAREIGRRLADVTARVAKREGADVLAADRLSRAHTACDAEPWSFGTSVTPGEGMIWHPTAAGHAALAAALERHLRR